MEELIYSALSGAVSWPVAWGSLGAGTTVPRAAIYRTSGIREMHMEGTGLMETRLQIDVYGATPEEAMSASREVRTVLEGYQSGVVQGVFLEATRDGFEDDAQLLHRVSLSFAVWHRD